MSVIIIAPVFICYSFTITLGSSYSAIGKPLITVINQLIANLILPISLPIIFALSFNNYYGIIIGISVSAILSIAIVSIGLAIIHKPHKVFLPPVTEEIQFSENLYITDENIPLARENILSKLTINQIEDKPKQELIDIFDEACLILKKYNPNKVVAVRLTFCISKDKIRLISKNTGRILSKEEKLNEIKNNRNDHITLNTIYESSAINMSTMISFNSQLTIINRN